MPVTKTTRTEVKEVESHLWEDAELGVQLRGELIDGEVRFTYSDPLSPVVAPLTIPVGHLEQLKAVADSILLSTTP